jgi:hypothetical protein
MTENGANSQAINNIRLSDRPTLVFDATMFCIVHFDLAMRKLPLQFQT